MSTTVDQTPVSTFGVAANGLWYAWTPADGPLVITAGQFGTIASLWLPQVETDIAFASTVGGTPFYTTNQPGPEIVPLPSGTTTVVLSGTYLGPLYVYATTVSYPPYKDTNMAGIISPGSVVVAADGSATTHVTLTFPYNTINAIDLTTGFNGTIPVPTPTLVASYGNKTTDGFDIMVTGGAPGSTANVDYMVSGV